MNPKKVDAEENVTEATKPVEEVKVEEPKVAEPVAEEAQTEERTRKPKKGAEAEVNKEDLLERPENALTLEEYMAQKSQTLKQEVKTVERPAGSLALNPKTKNENEDVIGVSSQAKKQKTKTKETKVNPNESELNKVFASNLKLEDNTVKRDFRGPQQKSKNTGDKFRFAAEEFPSL